MGMMMLGEEIMSGGGVAASPTSGDPAALWGAAGGGAGGAAEGTVAARGGGRSVCASIVAGCLAGGMSGGGKGRFRGARALGPEMISVGADRGQKIKVE